MLNTLPIALAIEGDDYAAKNDHRLEEAMQMFCKPFYLVRPWNISHEQQICLTKVNFGECGNYSIAYIGMQVEYLLTEYRNEFEILGFRGTADEIVEQFAQETFESNGFSYIAYKLLNGRCLLDAILTVVVDTHL